MYEWGFLLYDIVSSRPRSSTSIGFEQESWYPDDGFSHVTCVIRFRPALLPPRSISRGEKPGALSVSPVNSLLLDRSQPDTVAG